MVGDGRRRESVIPTDRQTEQNTRKGRGRERERDVNRQRGRGEEETDRERWERRPKKISMGSYCPIFSFIPILPREPKWSIILYTFQF